MDADDNDRNNHEGSDRDENERSELTSDKRSVMAYIKSIKNRALEIIKPYNEVRGEEKPKENIFCV